MVLNYFGRPEGNCGLISNSSFGSERLAEKTPDYWFPAIYPGPHDWHDTGAIKFLVQV